MSTVAVAGGTGALGALLFAELRARGHDVRSLSRGSSQYPVDLTTGRGLERALDGVDVVVQAANGPASGRAAAVLVDGTRRLLEASAAHHVCVSIVGIEDVPLAYYRVKIAEEQAVRGGGRPWTIVRSTQFHEFLGGLVRAAGARHVRLRSAALFQPVAVAEAARAVADVAQAPARQAIVSVAGPQVLTLSALSDAGGRGIPLPVLLPPRLGRALRAGLLTTDAPDVRGTTTFAAWLTTH